MPDIQGEIPPFALLKVVVRGRIIPQFGYKIVPLQYCQKASQLFLQVAAELGGGFSHGQPDKDEYQIRLVLPTDLGSVNGKHHVVSDDDDLRDLLLPFTKPEVVLESSNVPLILVDFMHNEHFNLAAKRSLKPKVRKFHRMVDMVKPNSESLYAGPNLVLSLLNVVHELEQSKEHVSNGRTEACLEAREQEDTDEDETRRPKKRQKLTDFITLNTQKRTPNDLAADQAAQDQKLGSLLEDKARLSEEVSKLAGELEHTRFVIHDLRLQRKQNAETECFRAYESLYFDKKSREVKASLIAVQKEKKLIEAKSVYLVKRCQSQSDTLKQAESFINYLEKEMKVVEAEKNTRIGDLEDVLRKALGYIDGLHKHFGISTAASSMLAQQFCDNLRDTEIHAAAQPDMAEEERKRLKRKRSESET